MAGAYGPGGLRMPQQARSRATLDRIVIATQELLEEKTFDEISVTEIVDRAHSSVGAFYARFPDKAALLDHLDELYARRMVECAAEAATAVGNAKTTLVEDVRGLVAFLLEIHRLQPGLLRTLIIEARRRPDGPFGDRTRRMNRMVPPLMGRLMRHEGEMAHPQPARAAYLGLLMVFAAIREVTLFPEGLAEFVDYDDLKLIDELTDAYLRYLGVAEPA